MSDLISREDAVSRISDLLMIELQGKHLPTWNEVYNAINDIPSAEPEEFEWCHDCKEYDAEQHCCHRWTKFIRKTVDELKANGRTAKVNNAEDPYGLGMYGYCSECDAMVNENYAFCPNCGARLEWNE